MSEEVNMTTPVAEPPVQAAPPKKPAGKKHRKGHPVRNAIIAIIVIAALGTGGFFLFRFLNKPEEVESQMQTATADWSSIQSTVQGSGSARAKESTAITLQNAGIVQKVYVSEGQMISEGDPLYEIVSPAAQEAYNAAVKRVGELQDGVQKQYEELQRLQENLATRRKEYQDILDAQVKSNRERYIKVPFSGQLQDTVDLQLNADVAEGTKIATLVDDSKFRISFYFSYGYEGQIQVGRSVDLTVSNTAANLTGVVEEINMVRRVSPEGSLLFEVIVTVENPGALSRGLTATASIPAGDTVLYPYDQGTLDYYRTVDILTKTTGQVLSASLRDYADVTEGQTILTLSEEDFSDRLEAKNNEIIATQDSIKAQNAAIETAQQSVVEAEKAVEEAQKALDDFSAVSPMSGTITSCTLVEGQEVKSGDTVITISNNTTMIVNITVDDRNIAYVKPGMMVDLMSNWGDGGSFVGVVTKIDMSLSGNSMGAGMTNYPVTLEVDNFGGTLLEGMWLSYSFVTSQSDNCIVVPMQSVKYISTEDGGTASVVFIQADSKPDNAVDMDLPELMPGETPQYPSEKDGYYAVPVTTGLSDNYNVEITDGLQGGETIFVAYLVEQAWG